MALEQQAVTTISIYVPHVKVVGYAKAVTVSGKIVPLVHINAIPLVGHNLWFMNNYQL